MEVECVEHPRKGLVNAVLSPLSIITYYLNEYYFPKAKD